MTGWCPIHDRTFEAGDGLCPKCGTALVTDDAPDERPIVIEQTTPLGGGEVVSAGPRGRPATSTVAGIAAAIVIAFVAGLAFPRGEEEPAPAALPEITADLSVGATRHNAGVPLRLESFTQRGRNMVARLTVADGADIDLGRLRSVSVTYIMPGGGEISDEVSVRATVAGFILEGALHSSPTSAVLGLRIEALNFAAGSGADIPIDISGAWPATRGNQPRASKATGALKPGDGRTLSISGLVGWVDRLEIGLTVKGARPGWVYGSEFQLVSQSLHSGILLEGAGTSTVRFESLPTDKRRWALRVAVSGISAIGPWEWSFV
jgi:hypothetical protein